MSTFVEIDGSEGEGGGQMLRSSLALSVLTGRPFKAVNIRANRKKPGLAAQHLTSVRAAAAICKGQYKGGSIGSSVLVFEPGEVVSWITTSPSAPRGQPPSSCTPFTCHSR